MTPEAINQLCKDAEAAFSAQSAHVGLWREALAFCVPYKATSVAVPGATPVPYQPNPDKHNSTAQDALLTLARGLRSKLTPTGNEWIQFAPAPEVEADSVRRWLLDCTRRTMPLLEVSGFYTAEMECFIDAIATGNTTMRVERGKSAPLAFSVMDIGSFAMAEDGEGKVRKIWQRLTRTVSEAAAEWGEESLPAKLRELTAEKRLETREVFLVCICGREKPETEVGPLSMPWAVTVIHEATKHLVSEGGTMEWPAPVLRWLEISGPSVWGVGPGVMALADSRGVNFLDLMMATAVEKLVDPPLAAKNNVSGALDLRAGGVTIVSDLNDRPQVIAEVGDVRFLDGFLAKKERQLQRFFHWELFNAFLAESREITAQEARLKHGEKLEQFLETYSRIVSWLNEILERVFMLLLREGFYAPPPPEAFLSTPAGEQFLYPKIVHQSPLALAMNSVASNSIRQFLGDILPVAQINPEVLDHIDFGRATRIMGQESAALAQIIRPLEEVQVIQEQRRQQQMAMMAAQAAMQAAAKGGGNAAPVA